MKNSFIDCGTAEFQGITEFDVLERMLELNVFDSIQKIYVEFHERFFDDISLYENKKLRLISAMKAHETDVVDWF